MRRIPVIALAVVLVVACNGTTAPAGTDYDALPADQVLYNVDHMTTVNGVRRSNLRSDTTMIFEDSASVQLRGVHLETYDDTGRLTATLTSASGELNRTTNKMVARGNVELRTKGPPVREIFTEELHYDPQTKRVWSDVPFRMIEAGGGVTRGTSFESDDQFRNVRVKGQSSTNLQIPIG